MSGLDGEQIALWALRGVGALWAVGGVALLRQLWFWNRLEKSVAQIEAMTRAAEGEGEGEGASARSAAPDETDDPGRNLWMAAGGVLTLACGLLLLGPFKLSVAGVAALIVHQLAYFIRQRRLELAARTAEGREHAQPSQRTINAFFFSLIVAVVAAWLYHKGQLI